METMRANPPKHWLPTTIKMMMTNLGGGMVKSKGEGILGR